MRFLLLFSLLFAQTADAAPGDSYWLWAIDGRFEKSKAPCSTNTRKVNPAKQAVIDFIGSETFVLVDADGISLLRDRVTDIPKKRLVGPSGEQIAIWYRGARTWVVTLYPTSSPAFVSVTLVMEKDEKRQGTPVCHERWIAPVSP